MPLPSPRSLLGALMLAILACSPIGTATDVEGPRFVLTAAASVEFSVEWDAQFIVEYGELGLCTKRVDPILSVEIEPLDHPSAGPAR